MRTVRAVWLLCVAEAGVAGRAEGCGVAEVVVGVAVVEVVSAGSAETGGPGAEGGRVDGAAVTGGLAVVEGGRAVVGAAAVVVGVVVVAAELTVTVPCM